MINIFEVHTWYKPKPSGQPLGLTSLTLVVLVGNIMWTTVVFDANKCDHQLAYLHQMWNNTELWSSIKQHLRNDKNIFWAEREDIETLVNTQRFWASATCFEFLHQMHSMPQKCEVCNNAAVANGDAWLVEELGSWEAVVYCKIRVRG